MPTIIKKGTNSSAFRLKNGHTIVLQTGFGGGEHLNILTDKEFDDLMSEYGTFIRPRILSDKNPDGCFIIHDKREYAEDMNNEVGEIRDNSAPVQIDNSETEPEHLVEIKTEKPVKATKRKRK